jgi:glutathione synthase
MHVGIVMDPIERIQIKKDSSFAMLLAAQARGHRLSYFTDGDLSLRSGRAVGQATALKVKDDPAGWFEFGERAEIPLDACDVILMRKDPPFDTQFLYDTMLLEQAEARGTLVVNRPQGLRDANEKLFTAWFPQCTPEVLVSRDREALREFVLHHGDCVIKPLDSMGGNSIFRARRDDLNLNVILETVGANGRSLVMAQRYLPEILDGDKRILLIDGEAVPYALARIPSASDFRGNLAKGGRGEARPLTDRDRWLCAQIGPELKRRGMLFVGLDVIGDYVTEINVTSPTCIRELDRAFDLDIAGQLFDVIEAKRG